MSQEERYRVFLGLGGNLGEPLAALVEARRQLAGQPEIELLASSPLYRTPAVGGPAGQPDYLNAVLEISTSLSPQQLLHCCQQIETAGGRVREVRWGARTLDIDLLCFGQLQLDGKRLVLPHPRLHLRHFVLLPLADLAPTLRHPRLKRSVAELLAALPTADGIVKLTDQW